MSQPKVNDEKMRDRARALRRESTVPERILWGFLRGGRLGGYKFRRQFAIGPFIVDFCCVERRIVIEVDGMTHVGCGVADDQRTAALARMGYRVVRVTNDDVLQHFEAVADFILRELEAGSSPHATAPKQRPSPPCAPSPVKVAAASLTPSPRGRGSFPLPPGEGGERSEPGEGGPGWKGAGAPGELPASAVRLSTPDAPSPQPSPRGRGGRSRP